MNNSDRRVFVTDCEGPLTINDNAAEMAEAFLPEGDLFFSKVSLYDDYLSEIAHKENYKAGDTLRLILPFFKAFGVDDRSMVKFSRKNIEVIPKASEAIGILTALAPCYIVSTSYTPYIKAVCDALAFPIENTFSTQVNLDSFNITSSEKALVKEMYSRIIKTPLFTLTPGARSIGDLNQTAQDTIAELDDIFWRELPSLEINELLICVNPVGGKEKAAAIETIIERRGCELKDVIYVGDSITDVDAFRLVRSGGGLAVSFNGNDWAVREASVAVTAFNAMPTAFIASLFLQGGIQALDSLLVTHLHEGIMDHAIKHSVKVRKALRSEKIGSLG